MNAKMPVPSSEPSFKPGVTIPIAIPSSTGTANQAAISRKTHVDWSEQQLPDKRMQKWSRKLRFLVFSAYRTLFTTVFLCNVVAILVLWADDRLVGTKHILTNATAVSANLFVATAIRQEYIINSIFRTCWLVPHSTPLRIRCLLAKCYEYGGVHSGAAISGTFWFVILTGNVSRSFARKELESSSVVVITGALMAILLVIVGFAYPRVRTSLHDLFERTHRWAGWTAIVVFWAEVVLIAWEMHERPSGIAFAQVISKQPSFWLLLFSTFHAIHPWTRLRRWKFEHQKLSSHAIKLTFSRKIPKFSGIAISKSPLKEWHPFATFPRKDGKQGGSLVISNAGDFTNDLIRDPQPQYWVKGLPRHGPMSMAQIFRSVVFVTTGSGIGPCLTFLADASRRQPVRILWSAPHPLQTFGEDICQTVRMVDHNAMIIDTRAQGRPNLPLLTFRLYKEAQAEAVFVLSNAKLTRKVKYAMQMRGIPVFGPIFDS